MSVATPPARTPEVKLPVDTEAPVGTEAVRGGSPVSATASPVRAPAVDQPAEAPVGADAPRGKRKRRRRKRPRQSQQEETPYLTSDGCSDDNRPARIPVHLRLGDRAGEPHGPRLAGHRLSCGWAPNHLGAGAGFHPGCGGMAGGAALAGGRAAAPASPRTSGASKQGNPQRHARPLPELLIFLSPHRQLPSPSSVPPLLGFLAFGQGLYPVHGRRWCGR